MRSTRRSVNVNARRLLAMRRGEDAVLRVLAVSLEAMIFAPSSVIWELARISSPRESSAESISPGMLPGLTLLHLQSDRIR